MNKSVTVVTIGFVGLKSKRQTTLLVLLTKIAEDVSKVFGVRLLGVTMERGEGKNV
jgi:hypothetical protein